jgi:CBS domain-containing protein
MRTVKQLLDKKGHDIRTIDAGSTVLDAAKLMTELHIGSLVVTRKPENNVVGIFTERDIMRRVVAEARDSSKILVREVMTAPIVCCAPSTTLDEVRALMREKKIRHVPVIENAALKGMISLIDLNIVLEETQQATIQYLEQFIYKP